MFHSALVLVPENRFAHAAAIRLLDDSNTAVPIVTIYGASGVGKSQMARHVARQGTIEDPNLSFAYLTAAEFSLELAKASDAGVVDEFQAAYRKHRLFICEDIQSVTRRPESQAQLLAVINDIVAQGGRVLLTCHRPPGELKGLSSKLVNRCHGGVCGEIEMPGPGTRAILLQEFAAGRGVVLKDHWVQKLAKRINSSPRELMGAIVQLETMANAKNTSINDAIVTEYLDQLKQPIGPTLTEVTKQVASLFDVPVKELRDGGRGLAVVVPRQVAMYLCREGGGHRFKEIGHYFGGRTHSTVVHACNHIAERLPEDSTLGQQVQQLCDQLHLPSSRQVVDET